MIFVVVGFDCCNNTGLLNIKPPTDFSHLPVIDMIANTRLTTMAGGQGGARCGVGGEQGS